MTASSASVSRSEKSSGATTTSVSSENRPREWLIVRARPVVRSMRTTVPCSVWWMPASRVSLPVTNPASRNSRRARASSRGADTASRMRVASSLTTSRCAPLSPSSRDQNRGHERRRSWARTTSSPSIRMAARRPGWEVRTSGSVGSEQSWSARTHRPLPSVTVSADVVTRDQCGLLSRRSTSIALTVSCLLKPADQGRLVRPTRLTAPSVSQL